MDKNTQKRVNTSLIYASFDRPRATVLLGARRVGKTTLLKTYIRLHPKRKWVFLNMDDREERLRIEKGELTDILEEKILRKIGGTEKVWVAIDEAQKCPFEIPGISFSDNAIPRTLSLHQQHPQTSR